MFAAASEYKKMGAIPPPTTPPLFRFLPKFFLTLYLFYGGISKNSAKQKLKCLPVHVFAVLVPTASPPCTVNSMTYECFEGNNINSQLEATNFIDDYNQINMFRAIISPTLRSTRLCLQLVV